MAGERSPIWNSKARGVLFGLSYDKTRAHIIRSIMEGVGYSLLHNLKTAEEVNAHVEELISVGGASNSIVWTQIKADITGKKIMVPEYEEPISLGTAILAAVEKGYFKSIEEAVKKKVKMKRVYTPDVKEYYREGYKRFTDIYKQLIPVFRGERV